MSKWFVLAIGAFAFWSAQYSLGKGGMDDYNYEFQAIRWFHDCRIVPIRGFRNPSQEGVRLGYSVRVIVNQDYSKVTEIIAAE